MEKELYIVEFCSANYAGASSHCLVWATSVLGAEALANQYAEEYYREEDGDQIADDGLDDEPASSIIGAELVEDSDHKEYVNDPSQVSFYPVLNSKN